MCIASNWQLWHSLPTKDTLTIRLIGNHTHSRPIWEIIVHAISKIIQVYYKFISGHLAKFYSKFIRGGLMQLRLEIWQRFITSLLVGDRCSLSMGIWQRFITSILVGDRCSSGWRFGKGLFQVY